MELAGSRKGRWDMHNDEARLVALLNEKTRLFHFFKLGTSGFRFGLGKFGQAEARRRRKEINALKAELAALRGSANGDTNGAA